MVVLVRGETARSVRCTACPTHSCVAATRVAWSEKLPAASTDTSVRVKLPKTWRTGDRINWPESWGQAAARYQRTLCEVQRAAPFAVLVTHGAGVQSIAESVLSIKLALVWSHRRSRASPRAGSRQGKGLGEPISRR